MSGTNQNIKKKKAVVAGHICLDITPVFPVGTVPAERAQSIGDLLVPGKLINVDGVEVSTGGAVANTGLAMKILGADVSLAAKLGEDSFSEIVLGILRKYGADGDMVVSPETSTSYTVVFAIPGFDRIFLHNPGANNSFCSDDVNDSILKDAALLHFGYPPLMQRMYQNEGEELVSLFSRVKKMGVVTSLDMAAVDPNSEAGGVNWRRILEKVLPYTDIFAPSIEEICFMLNREKYEEWQVRAAGQDITKVLSIEEDIQPIADELISLGAKIVLLKCGVAGMYLQTVGAESLTGISKGISIDVDEWAGARIFERSFKPEKVLSTTGAGDTSIAAFLTAILDGRSAEESIRLAAATGACCVTAYDALGGLRPLDELSEKIDAGWEKLKID